MSDAERFDALYAAARDRLLTLAFALTGDLPASRGAVRDAFIAAWHHWRKVGRLEDPEAWVRRHAWSHAQRRHTARIWHRDKHLDPEVRATLDALAKLPVDARKTLLVTQLTTGSQETGVSLDRLAEHCADQRWPRATIIRRAGAGRRRTHLLAGATLVVAALVGSGFLVQDSRGVHPTLAAAGDRITSVPAGTLGTGTTDTAVTTDALVTRSQVTHALSGRTWHITGTDPAERATLPCQQRAYADPDAETTLVRNFTARRQAHQPSSAAVQTVEYSSDDAGAARGYAAASGWFAGCLTPGTQLLSVRRVSGLGDQAEQFTFRAWQAKTQVTFVIGLARTGRVTTVALTSTDAVATPDEQGNLGLLTSAVDDLCATSVGGLCSSRVEARTVPPPPAGTLPMMVSEFDLPPVTGVSRPWVGTTARQALQNLAATGCDDSSFHGPGWTHDATRSFLVPGAHLSSAFGLTETVGRLPEQQATAFLAHVRSKLASCPQRDLASKVKPLAHAASYSVWRVRTQVSKKQTMTFDMGVVRRGGAVAQIGFVPDGSHSMPPAQFVALVRRAGDRLAQMPG